MLNSLQF